MRFSSGSALLRLPWKWCFFSLELGVNQRKHKIPKAVKQLLATAQDLHELKRIFCQRFLCCLCYTILINRTHILIPRYLLFRSQCSPKGILSFMGVSVYDYVSSSTLSKRMYFLERIYHDIPQGARKFVWRNHVFLDKIETFEQKFSKWIKFPINISLKRMSFPLDRKPNEHVYTITTHERVHRN